MHQIGLGGAIAGENRLFIPVAAGLDQPDQPLNIDSGQLRGENADGVQDVEGVEDEGHWAWKEKTEDRKQADKGLMTIVMTGLAMAFLACGLPFGG